jgi:hypothetical protein
MTLYKCECGKQEKEVVKAKIVYRDNNWVVNVMCDCNKPMTSEPVDGMPTLIRTEDTLNKNDKLWSKAKERLSGEQSYKSLKDK